MPRDLPLGNGTILVNYDSSYVLRDIYYPYVGKENQTVGHPNRLGVWVEGKFSWVGEPGWRLTAKYMPETLVTDVHLRNEQLGVELILNDAVEFFLWVYLRQITIKDLTGKAREVRVFFNQDFHISETEVGDTAYFDPRTNSVVHYKSNRYFLINAYDGTSYGVHQFATGTKKSWATYRAPGAMPRTASSAATRLLRARSTRQSVSRCKPLPEGNALSITGSALVLRIPRWRNSTR